MTTQKSTLQNQNKNDADEETFASQTGKITLENLKKRCDEHNIVFGVDDEDDDIWIKIDIKRGRGARRIFVLNPSDARKLLRTNFQNFVFLEDVEAIWDPSSKIVEAAIQGVPSNRSTRALHAIFRTEKYSDLQEKIRAGIILKGKTNDSPIINIGAPSKEFSSLVPEFLSITRNPVTIKLKNVQTSSGEHTLRILNKISNSLFFQIDVSQDTSIGLVRARNLNYIGGKFTEDALEIRFPEYEYESGPIALYWYARNATGLPLLQYLAYYQVIEYFFGHYAAEEAASRIKTILKHPTFQAERSSDILKIINAVSNTKGGHTVSEQEQLNETIRSCISAVDMRSFLGDESITNFLKSNDGKKFHPIPLRNEDTDLRHDIAKRIYDIRCRIVHTKADGGRQGVELLLPFSKEANLLGHDIEIIKFIARKVLINSSDSLNLS